jgi:hypothetical protein
VTCQPRSQSSPGGAVQGLQALHSNLRRGHDRLGHCGLSQMLGAAVLHRLYGSLSRSAILGSDARAPRETLMDSNDKPPYRHWHTVCAACRRVTLARACTPPRPIEPIEHNPVVKCQHCSDVRQYLTGDYFLAPISATVATDRSSGTVALVTGLIAAVKLARVESRELQNRSPRVRLAIADSITIARMLIEASKAKP